jgi:transcriptional regulator with XRE-family HTH domain
MSTSNLLKQPFEPNEHLRYQRLKRQWTQADLAERLYEISEPSERGIGSRGAASVGMVSRWERGEYQPSAYWQKKLCEVFELPPEELGLLGETPAPAQKELPPKPIPSKSILRALKTQSLPFDEGQLPPPECFVGRQEDLEWVLERLREERTAAVTALNGLGGIGKTTLAAVAVHKLRKENRFPDGIAVIFCIGLTDATDVLRRVLARFDQHRRQPDVSDHTALYEIACQRDTLRADRSPSASSTPP